MTRISGCFLLIACFLGPYANASILNSASTFAVLTGTTVTNTGASVITGDLGVSPGTAITGFPPGSVVGTIHDNDSTAMQGQVDLASAYSYLSGLAFGTQLSNIDLGGLTLTAGVYKFDAAAALNGTLTLSGPGLFIFQIGAAFGAANDSAILTEGGADAANVYFVVGSSATAGTGAQLQGDIVALQSISLSTGTSLNGRALAINGAVTLQDNAITLSSSAPEPATFALFGTVAAGVFGFVMFRRR